MEQATATGKTGGGASVYLSTDSVSGPEGFGWWGDMVSSAVMPVSMASEHAAHFKGEVTALELADTAFSAFSFSPMSARRTPSHIRTSDPENYFLFLVHGSPIGLEQRRNNVLLRAGDVALFDTSQPLVCDFQGHGRNPRVSILRLPRAAVPLPRDKTDRLVATPLTTRTGSGALLTSYLAGLRENAAHCGPTELHRLGAMALELAITFLAARLDTSPTLPVESRQRVLLARINAFIDHNLHEPDLGPATIAAHHHISIRLLHALFEEEPETVSATIRRRRLERSRADLVDPRLRHRTIGEIADRWGFRHPAAFSRTFREAYGISPTEARSALHDKQPCTPR
ncbi:helix-turn-helix domain-containing protein [Streptomyces sp. E5N298]|uniref:AraC-like ligand-binding domain-containing protein n=1 Tax=Streptomyces sp. E5N298 TaxID=1851983 RepID=UPI000EF580DF|nr:helix-turn-helix domain-containing protein [Streptomyces sp. E5N298]